MITASGPVDWGMTKHWRPKVQQTVQKGVVQHGCGKTLLELVLLARPRYS